MPPPRIDFHKHRPPIVVNMRRLARVASIELGSEASRRMAEAVQAAIEHHWALSSVDEMGPANVRCALDGLREPLALLLGRFADLDPATRCDLEEAHEPNATTPREAYGGLWLQPLEESEIYCTLTRILASIQSQYATLDEHARRDSRGAKTQGARGHTIAELAAVFYNFSGYGEWAGAEERDRHYCKALGLFVRIVLSDNKIIPSKAPDNDDAFFHWIDYEHRRPRGAGAPLAPMISRRPA